MTMNEDRLAETIPISVLRAAAAQRRPGLKVSWRYPVMGRKELLKILAEEWLDIAERYLLLQALEKVGEAPATPDALSNHRLVEKALSAFGQDWEFLPGLS